MAVTITKPTIGGSEDSWGLIVNTALDDIVDGLNGVTTVAPNLTEGSWQIGGVAVGSTAAELNILDGVTASTAEINVLDGVTASTAEINYLDGVTSPIQTQINDLVAGTSGGTVTSVGLSVPTGFAVSGSPVTTSGTLGLSFASGYSLLTSAQATSISNIPTATSQLTNDSGFITAASVPDSLGVNQTWQSPSRSIAVIYQNTTGKPIQVSVGTGAQNTIGLRVGASSGSLSLVASAAYYSGFQCVIPNGHYYEVYNINGGNVGYWYELR